MDQTINGYSYSEDALLGEGGFARVYKARDTSKDVEVALKILKREFEESTTILESFFQDPQLVRAFDHQNIIRILDVGPTERPYYFSMEYCRGGDLRRMIHARRRLPIRTALGYAIPICDALSYCHSAELFHRDIKASNILFRDLNTPVLSDFGNAVAEYRVSVDGPQNIGSPPYVSPEVWEEKEYTTASDLYSLGVLFYYALTGTFPFSAKSVDEYKKMHLFVSPAAPSKWRPSVITGLDEIVLALLEKDGRNRISTAQELKASLESIHRQYYGEPDTMHRFQVVLCMEKEKDSGVLVATFPYRIGKMDATEGGEMNDFVVRTPDPFVSRFHGVIEQIEDGFLYTDVSTNGSIVNGSFIHKQSIELLRENTVVLGERTQLFIKLIEDRFEQREQGTSVILPEMKKPAFERFKENILSIFAIITAVMTVAVLFSQL
ncbi:MAG: protein kinase [Ignavibacteriales bacterium]|nr:protein kinase [Ignavibacteriales bacterium]